MWGRITWPGNGGAQRPLPTLPPLPSTHCHVLSLTVCPLSSKASRCPLSGLFFLHVLPHLSELFVMCVVWLCPPFPSMPWRSTVRAGSSITASSVPAQREGRREKEGETRERRKERRDREVQELGRSKLRNLLMERVLFFTWAIRKWSVPKGFY